MSPVPLTNASSAKSAAPAINPAQQNLTTTSTSMTVSTAPSTTTTTTAQTALVSSSGNGLKTAMQTPQKQQQQHQSSDFITNFFKNINMRNDMQQQKQQQQQQQVANQPKNALAADKKKQSMAVATAAVAAAATSATDAYAKSGIAKTTNAALQKPEQISNKNNNNNSNTNNNNNNVISSSCNANIKDECEQSVVEIKTEVPDSHCQEAATAVGEAAAQQQEQLSQLSTSSSSSSLVATSLSTTVKAATKENETPNTNNSSNNDSSGKANNCNNNYNSSSSSGSNDNDHNNTSSSDNIMFAKPRPVLLSAVNPHIICNLCQGYLIDATTIVECLHSFCHSCIMRHLRTEQYCPRCEMMINTAKPNIKSDTTLQAIVYKLVPGLYEKELMKRRAFYKDLPEEAALATPEQRGDDTEHLIFSPSEYMSLSLEYADIEEHIGSNGNETEFLELLKPKFLQCPAVCTVAHLKKFVYGKFDIDINYFQVDIMYKVKTIVLLDHYTLMDVAYIYTWKRDAPMRFYFSVKESPKPIIKVRKAPKVNSITTASTVVTKEEVLSDHETPQLKNETMTTIHLPTQSVNTEDVKLEEIKEEDIETDAALPSHGANETKTFEIVPQPNTGCNNGSGQELSKTDKLKITIVSKGSRDKQTNSGDLKSPAQTKPPKEKKEQPAAETKEERKVENIKLKIDLSKQNSVTIINLSDPDRKEIVKPVKPEKEWKVKSKKDKGDSPKSNLASDRKRKTPSPLTVPPLTIKAERISPLTKTSPKQHSLPKSPICSPPQLHSEEDQKSQFLKSFSLTPIKDVKVKSPEKLNISPKQSPTKLTKCNVPPTQNLNSSLNLPTFNMLPKLSLTSKRKSKEPVKAILKKPKLSPPLPLDDFKIKLPPHPNSSSNKASKPLSTMSLPFMSSTTTTSTEKSLMPPPAPFSFMKPSNAPPKQKPQKQPSKFAPPGSLTPHPMQDVQPAPPGNRTPIAKRYHPILPKASRPNPFANIPTDVNKILKDAGTEIKSISTNDIVAPPKVYGPKTLNTNSMGPPPSPVQSTQSNNRNLNPQNLSKPSNSNSYLNMALFNSSKSKGKEVPPGCRTPMYSPSSPIYSPSSPQYAPNYNIPTIPTYKYTPKPSNGSSSYLQNVLGTNGQMSSLFPAPPTKKVGAESAPTAHAKRSNSPIKSEPPKRVYPFVKSPSPIEDPPEKQLKVKSLLTSCNINIPSSLSITITREDGESQSSSASYPKHKSPVNNYIEILKLPDQPAESVETKRRPSPSRQNATPPKKEQTHSQSQLQPPVHSHLHAALTSINNKPPPHLKNLNNNLCKTSVQNVSATNALSKTTLSNTKNTKTTTTYTQSTANNNASAAKTPLHSTQVTTSQLYGVKNNTKSTENSEPIDKKTRSPEKRPLDGAANTQMESKSPKSPNSDPASAAKKFRPILPRQNPTAISEIVPPKVNPGNIIGTYSSPSGVAVKVHANKKVSPPAKKSPTQAQTLRQNATNNTSNNNRTSLPKTSPNSTCTIAKPTSTTTTAAPTPKSSPNTPAHNSNPNKTKKSSSNPSPATTNGLNSVSSSSSSSSNATNGLNKLIPPAAPSSYPALNAMSTLPPSLQALSGIPNMPAHLAAAANAANQAEISKFLKDNIFRAQAQAAAANQTNMLYSYANAAAQMGQYTPSIYNYQQAYIMEQLSRMQRAGNDALVEYMQKLKGANGSGSAASGEKAQSSTPMGGGASSVGAAAFDDRNNATAAPLSSKVTSSSSKITSPTGASFNGKQQTSSKLQTSAKTK